MIAIRDWKKLGREQLRSVFHFYVIIPLVSIIYLCTYHHLFFYWFSVLIYFILTWSTSHLKKFLILYNYHLQKFVVRNCYYCFTINLLFNPLFSGIRPSHSTKSLLQISPLTKNPLDIFLQLPPSEYTHSILHCGSFQ